MLARQLFAGIVLAAVATGATAQTRVTYKSAASGSSYYQMGVQIAEAMDAATDGDIQVTVEESQGSVQNVMEVRARGGDYVFTTPPGLVGAAQSAAGPFEGRDDPAFDEIRALFPIPSLTMHFVMSADSGAQSIEDLAGKIILLGKGSFGATEGERYLELFGIADEVQVADVELSNAVPALQNGQIDGFVTAGSFPAPNVVEAAASTDVQVISLTDEQIEETGRTRLVIPAGTYAGQERGHRHDLTAGGRLHHDADGRRDRLSAHQDVLGKPRPPGRQRSVVAGRHARAASEHRGQDPPRRGALLPGGGDRA